MRFVDRIYRITERAWWLVDKLMSAVVLLIAIYFFIEIMLAVERGWK